MRKEKKRVASEDQHWSLENITVIKSDGDDTGITNKKIYMYIKKTDEKKNNKMPMQDKNPVSKHALLN